MRVWRGVQEKGEVIARKWRQGNYTGSEVKGKGWCEGVAGENVLMRLKKGRCGGKITDEQPKYTTQQRRPQQREPFG